VPRKSTTATINAEAVVRAVKETARFEIFLGTFAGTYVGVDYITAIWGRERLVISIPRPSM
jgi:hypothetical protein